VELCHSTVLRVHGLSIVLAVGCLVASMGVGLEEAWREIGVVKYRIDPGQSLEQAAVAVGNLDGTTYLYLFVSNRSI
jgi:hypothetical protein